MKHFLLAVVLGWLAVSSAYAQEPVEATRKVLAKDGSPTLIEFRGSTKYPASKAQLALTEQLQLGPGVQMRVARTETDTLGFVHEKYQQYYKGVKVEYGTYTVHARRGGIESLTGTVEHVQQLNTTPSVNTATALQHALAFVRAKKYMWQDAGEEAALKQRSNDPSATYQPQGELVVVKNPATKQSALAWKFNVYAQLPISRAYIYVDAHSGKVVFKDDIIKHAGPIGTFATRYSGTRTGTTYYNGLFTLEDHTRGSGIRTFNCNKFWDYAHATGFTDADNNWTAAEFNNANFDNAALDAHWNMQVVYDYWKNVFGRNSYNNQGTMIYNFVHYGFGYN